MLLVERVAPDEGMRCQLRSALRGDAGLPYRGRLLRRDGQEIAVQIDWSPRTGPNGVVVGLVVVVTDRTARRTVEQALRQTLERLQAVSQQLLEIQEQEAVVIWPASFTTRSGQQLTGLALTLRSGRRSGQSPRPESAGQEHDGLQVRDLGAQSAPGPAR